MSREIENRCQDRNVSMLYLTVNQDNVNEQALYRALGWKLASPWETRTKLLSETICGRDENIRFITLGRQAGLNEAIRLTRRYHGVKWILPQWTAKNFLLARHTNKVSWPLISSNYLGLFSMQMIEGSWRESHWETLPITLASPCGIHHTAKLFKWIDSSLPTAHG